MFVHDFLLFLRRRPRGKELLLLLLLLFYLADRSTLSTLLLFNCQLKLFVCAFIFVIPFDR